MSLIFARFALSVALAIAVFGCGNKEHKYAKIIESRVPLIPRKWLMSYAEDRSVQLSPDGQYVAYLSIWRGAKHIYVKSIPDGEPVRLTGDDSNTGVISFNWAYTSEDLLYTQDNNGDENSRLYSISVISREKALLTAPAGSMARVFARSYHHPEHVIIGQVNEEGTFYEYYKLDLKTGSMTFQFRHEGYKTCLFDKDLEVRLVSKDNGNGGTIYYKAARNDGDSGLQLTFLREISPDDDFLTQPLHFDDTGDLLWYDSIGRDKVALIAENLVTGHQTVVYNKSQKADIKEVLAHPHSGRALAVTDEYAKPARFLLDQSLAADFQTFKDAFRTMEIVVTSISLDFNTWLIKTYSDRQAPKYYSYNRLKGTLNEVLPSDSSLEQYTLARMHTEEIVVRDGLTQVCYLTLPHESDPNDTGRPSMPLPMVLYVHGGPWSRDTWGLNEWTQLLANRGYAVLQCNFRGSKGYGKTFLNTGNGQWGGKMQDDLTDGVKWAIKEKIALRKRVAIMGGSYGGYATLVGLASDPNMFACGIDAMGPSNLISFLESVRSKHVAEYKHLVYRLGDPESVKGRIYLETVSPVFAAQNIKKPLLMAHGLKDPRVTISESDQMVNALKMRHNLPVSYLVFHDEEHRFSRIENRVAFFAVVEQFLAKYLGGRAESVGRAFEGSSINIEFDSTNIDLSSKQPTADSAMAA